MLAAGHIQSTRDLCGVVWQLLLDRTVVRGVETNQIVSQRAGGTETCCERFSVLFIRIELFLDVEFCHIVAAPGGRVATVRVKPRLFKLARAGSAFVL